MIKPATNECAICGQARGYVHVGPLYAVESEKIRARICPWCIADSLAHDMFDLEFAVPEAIGGGGLWDSVPLRVIEEVAFHTPGYCGWQQEKWFTHCGDAAAFLGRVGYPEFLLTAHKPSPPSMSPRDHYHLKRGTHSHADSTRTEPRWPICSAASTAAASVVTPIQTDSACVSFGTRPGRWSSRVGSREIASPGPCPRPGGIRSDCPPGVTHISACLGMLSALLELRRLFKTRFLRIMQRRACRPAGG